MHSRRIFLKTIAPLAAAVSIPAKTEASQIDDCLYYADRLAAAMKAKHGGDWDVTLQPEEGCIFGRRIG